MSPVLLVLFVLAFLGIIIAIAVYQWQMTEKRRAAFRTMAAANGWTYLERDRDDRPHRYRAFEAFGKGHSRYAHDVLAINEGGATMEVFGYHYAVTTSNGKNRSTQHYYHRVCTIQMPLHAPNLTIRDEGLHHKIFDALGGEDIDFESDEFSRRFWVRCDDRRFAYDIIHTGMMEWLLPRRGWTWEWRAGVLMVHQLARFRPEDVNGLVGLLREFRAHLPRHRLAEAAAPTPTGA